MATYTELAALRRNSDFSARVEIAVAVIARKIMDEDPSTLGYKARFTWAVNAVANPGSVTAGILPAVALDPACEGKAAAPDTITDEELQTAVETAANRILGI